MNIIDFKEGLKEVIYQDRNPVNLNRELMEEAGIKKIQLIKGWRQQTQFFFKEERNGKKQLIKKDFILYLARLPKGQSVNISDEHNGYAWLGYKIAAKYLKFKSLKDIVKEADSYVNQKISEHQKLKRVDKK